MTTSKDREQLHALNGYASTTRWKREPTPIKPRDSAPGMLESGHNPFGQNPNRNRVVGNMTSTRVLSRPSDPPPRKKVKTEHLHTASGGTYNLKDGNNTPSNHGYESLITPETIDVDDYSVMLDNNSQTNSGNSSPDELNILSPSTEGAFPSKFVFNTPSHGSSIRNNNPPIAPDGKSTEWAKKKFPEASQVKEKVAKIEAKTRTEDQPNRIDLRTIKTKDRMKTKDKKSKFPPQQPSQEHTIRAPTKKNILPLKELYLDDTHYNSEMLEINWLFPDRIIIKSKGRPIFGPFDIRANAASLTCHGPDPPDPPINHDPIFQLKIISSETKLGSKVKCLTAKLDCSSPGAEETYYVELLEWLKTRVNNKEIIRAADRNKVWEAVVSANAIGSDFSTKQGGSGKRRLEELRQGEQRRTSRRLDDPKKRSASQSSLGFTPPPPSSITMLGDQKPKQRSRQNTSDLPVVPRRSTRNMSGATRSPALDSDEVILVYPSGVPGAVNITNGDYLRLQPGEFLNDTLIEFGLKLWLKELEQSDAILASQIHVFNSFFYKKLNHHQKGSPNLGYESVRKWTSKFDIFQKKYIIVPINEHLHWYFAIICDPEYVLVPTASNVTPPSTRQTRQSISETTIIDEPDETPTASKPVSASVSENGRDDDKFPSEAEVEESLRDFNESCTIRVEPDEDVAGADGERSPSALSYVTDDGVLTANLHTANHDGPVSEIPPVDTARFYQHAPPKRDKGKRKADSAPQSAMEIDDDEDDDGGSALNDTPKTFIFTFDSLGGRHPQAIRKLSMYLKMEARDKKKVENTGMVASKSVPVPAQPNFCDCGIYLLHLAQTFMSNPVHYRRMILAQKKGVPPEVRKAAWNDDQVSDKREDLRARIMNLSGEWKKERAAKEEAKYQETSNSHTLEVESDGEIDILEPTPSTSKAKSGGRTRQAANRLRG